MMRNYSLKKRHIMVQIINIFTIKKINLNCSTLLLNIHLQSYEDNAAESYFYLSKTAQRQKIDSGKNNLSLSAPHCFALALFRNQCCGSGSRKFFSLDPDSQQWMISDILQTKCTDPDLKLYLDIFSLLVFGRKLLYKLVYLLTPSVNDLLSDVNVFFRLTLNNKAFYKRYKIQSITGFFSHLLIWQFFKSYVVFFF